MCFSVVLPARAPLGFCNLVWVMGLACAKDASVRSRQLYDHFSDISAGAQIFPTYRRRNCLKTRSPQRETSAWTAHSLLSVYFKATVLYFLYIHFGVLWSF